MAQDAINRSAIDPNSLNQQQTSSIDLRQPQSQKSLLQHFNSETNTNQQQLTSQQQQQLQNNSLAATTGSNNGTSTGSGLMNVANATGQPISGNAKTHACQPQQMATTEAHIPTLLGVTPLGPTPLQKEHQMQFQMMEAAYYHLPQPMDTEKLQTYFHRAPVLTPSHYPQVSYISIQI